MKVLVTGATGFLGRWICKRLHAEGLDVRILKRRSKKDTSILGFEAEVAEGDITDYDSVEKAGRDVDSIFHLAGLVAYKPSDRAQMELVNVEGTRNIVKACIKNKTRRLLHMSSVVAIGASIDGRKPLDENSSFNLHRFNFGYFETKLMAEKIVLEACQKGQLDAVCINPSTIYGAADAEKGSRKTQLKVAQGKMPFYTSGGVSVVAVEDVVECAIAGWRKGRTGERYIISGENLLIKDLFRLIAHSANVAPPKILLPNSIVHTLGFTGDLLAKFHLPFMLNSESARVATMFHWFDNSKAKREFGIEPKPAALAIQNRVQWMKENGLLDLR